MSTPKREIVVFARVVNYKRGLSGPTLVPVVGGIERVTPLASGIAPHMAVPGSAKPKRTPFYGMYARIAQRLGVDQSHVRRIASGAARSRDGKVERALHDEIDRLTGAARA